MVSIPYLKKTTFTGSYQGMNYMLRKQSGEEGDLIEAIHWPGPFIFTVTPEEKKVRQSFPFSQEGIKEAVAWLNDACPDQSN